MSVIRWFTVCSLAVSTGCAARSSSPPVFTASPDEAPIAGPAVPPVYLHLVADEGSAFERSSIRDGQTAWDALCSAPCDGYVPAFGSYRVETRGHGPTPAFTLPGPPGTRIVLKVDDDGRVWTRDSVQLAADRAQAWQASSRR